MTYEITGRSFIGFARGKENSKRFQGFDPRTGETVGPDFFSATRDELERAASLAEEAFDSISLNRITREEKGIFLRTIASNIEDLGDQLIDRASLETGLPTARFIGERARTCNQLRMFADLVEEGSWLDARIDTADPDRNPLGKPDVRSMLRPLGPVAIFCASNFPLAFSVAGGDSASALAAGCPIVVNAHPAHPGTAELVASAISDAVGVCGLPPGMFSLLFSSDYEIGQELVNHAAIKAVGFTGSRLGGRTLMDIAAARPEPIPVFAEMSSVNPTFILPGAVSNQLQTIVTGLHASFTLGSGQFCTKPGVVVLGPGADSESFAAALHKLSAQSPAMVLLSSRIKEAYDRGTADRAKSLKMPVTELYNENYLAEPAVFEASAEDFLANNSLRDEIFGPTTLLVSAKESDDLLEIARTMEGQLTATIHGTESDLAEYADLVEILAGKAGRLVFNGFPTGVEVCHAMVHGGPYPATSAPRTTSVGTRAIERFTRLVCFQDFPQTALPDELKNDNPLNISRFVNGEITRSRVD